MIEKVQYRRYVETNGDGYVCKLPNTALVRAAIKLIKIGLNKTSYKLRIRGRHPNRRALYKKLGKTYITGTQNDVPVKHAAELALYFDVLGKSEYIGTSEVKTRAKRY